MLKGRHYLVLCAAMISTPAHAIDHCGNRKPVTCVVDGQTVWLRGEAFRFQGYEVPRTSGALCGGSAEAELGRRAADRLVEILNSGGLFMHRTGEDEEGRTLAKLFVSGRDVGEIMVAAGLARRLPNGRKFWCR